ncbi:ATP-binding protein [Vibrio sp. Isolate25]|uniref:ATP-binding protein n=1 Tax=unclassified Vibrio TaxID=2614977 RepID=UPI001EFCB081|nr:MULTISPECIES: ATP-binding protein [unclassified Vibrio]MCG9599137.1 ATP-binding protein [Vibrio sp. Isolate25]MCG9682540.1 ATP-binding protein [Vibrio sp. Isolate23]
MSSQSALERKLAREIAARKQAELLLEQKSLELYEANEHLKLVLTQLKRQTHKDLHKLAFEEQINETLIHFGRAFLSRTLDDGLLSSLLERLDSSSALTKSGLYIVPDVVSTVHDSHFGCVQREHIDAIKPYAYWEDERVSLPLEVDHQVVGELSVLTKDHDIDAEFIVSQMRLVADLLCSAISRQIMLTSNQEARARAEESERSTKEFVAMINHELRTPLNGLLGSAELLSDTSLDDEQRTLLTNLSHTGDFLRHIINDILDFSKMSAGMMDLIPSTFAWVDLNEMLQGVFVNKAKEKGVQFSIHSSSEVPALLIGDFDRICQILINLIGNAIKFTSVGSVTVEVLWSENSLKVSVKDTGIGIPEAAQPILFDPFVQADRTAKRHFEGTGLGLAICKNLIDLMEGEINFTSQKGVGTEFKVSIPLKVAEQESIPNKAESHTNAKPLESLSILVVDDIRMNQVIINQMLKKWSITPDIANNGVEAIQAALGSRYDLIFMDCRMPEMDGFEATSYLREQEFKLPIIALTAGTTLEEREKCIQCGMDDILTKPYTAKDLKLMLEKWA